MLIRPTIAAAHATGIDTVAFTGGVAANSRLRERLARGAAKRKIGASSPRAAILHRQRRDDRDGGQLSAPARRKRSSRPRRRGEPRALAVRATRPTPRPPTRARPNAPRHARGSDGEQIERPEFSDPGRDRGSYRRKRRISSPSDDVIEIGPGLGILTERILRRDVRRLTLVELDHATCRAPARDLLEADPSVAVDRGGLPDRPISPR